MADIILLIALVIHYYFFTRRARAIRKAWRRIAPGLASSLDDPPPPSPEFEPRGLDSPDPSDFTRPATAALGQRIAQWTGMPPHALRGLSVTIEIGVYRRRVRLISLTDDMEDRQKLDAYCYERQRIRRFPISRLLRVVDAAGHVHEGRSFIDAALALRARPGPSLLALEGVTQGAALLIAMALRNGDITPEDRRAITEFAHDEARAASYRHSDPLVQTLDHHVARLRPDLRLVEEALGWIIRQPDAHQRRALAYLRRLDPEGAFADGLTAVEVALNRPKPW